MVTSTCKNGKIQHVKVAIDGQIETEDVVMVGNIKNGSVMIDYDKGNEYCFVEEHNE